MSNTEPKKDNGESTPAPRFYANGIPRWSSAKEAGDALKQRTGNPVEMAALMVGVYAFRHFDIYKVEPQELYKIGTARKACDAAMSMYCQDFQNNDVAALFCVMHTMRKAEKQFDEGKDDRFGINWVFNSSKASDYLSAMARKGKPVNLADRSAVLDLDKSDPREHFDSKPITRPGPTIVVRDGALQQLVERALSLVADDDGLFINSDRLVMLGDQGIVDVGIDMLIARLTGSARWCKEREYTKDGETIVELKDIDCPLGIAKAVHGAKAWPGAKKLVGIVDHPIMRPDGTILDAPGYDSKTGYFYVATFDVPEVPKEPTVEQATESLARLSDLFVDFHYQNPKQRVVGIAAILTLVGRSAVDGPVPAFFFDAPDKASGKTLHLETISRIATGKDSVAAEFCADVKEQSKRFVGWAREGALGIFADNLKTGSHFGSEVIDRHLTATRVDGRSLGRTGQIKYDWRAVICVSGNNVQVRDETARRTLIARLYPLPVDKKDFKYDLRKEAASNRGRYIADALTVLRYHATTPRTVRSRSDFASFERWQAVIADAIVSAGGVDPVEFCADKDPNQTKADPDIAALILLVRNWADLSNKEYANGDNGVSARALARRIWPQSDVAGTEAEDFDQSSETMSRSESTNELGDALLEPTFLFDPRNGWTKGPSKLGVWFRKVKEKAIPGHIVFEEGQPAASKTWRLMSAKTNREGAALWCVRADGDDGKRPTPPLVLTPSEPKAKRVKKEESVTTH